MNNITELWVIFSSIVSFSFGCGVTYFTVRETRRHVNGVGRKTAVLVAFLLSHWEDEEERKNLMEFLHQ